MLPDSKQIFDALVGGSEPLGEFKIGGSMESLVEMVYTN